jgi:hypothetical protein
MEWVMEWVMEEVMQDLVVKIVLLKKFNLEKYFVL